MGEFEIKGDWLTSGLPNASMTVSGTWDDGSAPELNLTVSGPITKGVHRVGRFNWQVGYAGTAGQRNVVMVPGIKRHWFRWTAERALRRGQP